MTTHLIHAAALSMSALAVSALPAFAEWSFSDAPTPNAFVMTGDMTLELQCDRVRFGPADFEDSEEIVAQQAMSIRFMKNATTEAGAFQVGQDNATVQIADNYPVEVLFNDPSDYAFVLDQIAANYTVDLSKVDQDISYALFDLKGSSAAVKALRTACADPARQAAATMEAPEGVVYCGGGDIKRQVEYLILDAPEDEWDAIVTVNGTQIRALTAYSFFGNSEPPNGFVVALLGEDRSEFLVFRDGAEDWLEYGDYRYDKCN